MGSFQPRQRRGHSQCSSTVGLQDPRQEGHEASKHLSFSTEVLVENVPPVPVVQVDPVTEVGAHWRHPNLLRLLLLEDGLEVLIGLVLVEVEASAETNANTIQTFTLTALRDGGVWRTEHFPDIGLLSIIDQLREVLLEVLIEHVDEVHRSLVNPEWETLLFLF